MEDSSDDCVRFTFCYELQLVVGKKEDVASAAGCETVCGMYRDRDVYVYFAKLLNDVGCPTVVYLPTCTRSFPGDEKWSITRDWTLIEDVSSTGGFVDEGVKFRIGMRLVSPVF